MTDVRSVLLAMRDAIDGGEKSLVRALDRASCPHDVRDAVSRRLAMSAHFINAAGGVATAPAVVRRALAVQEVQVRLWNAEKRLSELVTFQV